MTNIKRGAHAVVIVIAVTFVGASAAQIIPAAFGIAVAPIPSEAPGSPEGECAEGVRALVFAVDRAKEEAWSRRAQLSTTADNDGDDPLRAFRAALAPEWNGAPKVEQACVIAREGAEAWAAVLRLRRAQEQVLLGALVELVPLRRDVMAHLPSNLR